MMILLMIEHYYVGIINNITIVYIIIGHIMNTIMYSTILGVFNSNINNSPYVFNNVLLVKLEGPVTGIPSIIMTCCKKKASFKPLY